MLNGEAAPRVVGARRQVAPCEYDFIYKIATVTRELTVGSQYSPTIRIPDHVHTAWSAIPREIVEKAFISFLPKMVHTGY